MIGLGHYLFVAAVLFTLGILGIFLNRKNVIVLLVAMIGAIVLTLRHKPNVKRQSIAAQVTRDPADAIEIRKVKTGQGI